MSADTCKHPETWFSRELCPPPCNSMHDICEECAIPADGCCFNPPGTYNAFAKESDDE